MHFSLTAGGPGAYNGGASSMTGIGNPNFQDPRSEKSWTQKISDKLGSISFSSKGSENAPLADGYSPDGDYKFTSNRPGNPFGQNSSTGSYQPSGGYNPASFASSSSSSSSSWGGSSTKEPVVLNGYSVSGYYHSTEIHTTTSIFVFFPFKQLYFPF